MEKSKKRNLSTSKLYIKHALRNQESFLFDKLQPNIHYKNHITVWVGLFFNLKCIFFLGFGKRSRKEKCCSN